MRDCFFILFLGNLYHGFENIKKHAAFFQALHLSEVVSKTCTLHIEKHRNFVFFSEEYLRTLTPV